MAEQSLKDKTVKGVAWSGIDNVTQFSVTFIVSIILARLLSPDDYGLIGIVTIFTSICTTIINGGFNAAIIREKAPTEDDYNTAFLTNLGLSIILYAVIFIGSPAIAHFFGRIELINLIRVSSLSMIVGAIGLVQQTRLIKRIDFKSQAKITLISSSVSGLTGIVLAIIGWGVWALVAQILLLQVLKTFLLRIFNKWSPSFKFSISCFKHLFGFGWNLMVGNLIDSVYTQLTTAVIGKYYTSAALGQYTRAHQFSSLFSSNLTTVIQRVSFPALSEIQDEKERLVAAYRKIIKTTMFIAFSLMFLLGAISEPLIFCLIGPKWHEASVYLPILCIIGSLYPLHAINLNMLQVQGEGGLLLGLEVIKKFIGVAPIVVGITIGIMPMLYVTVVVNVICFFINSYYSGKRLGYSSWMQIKDITPSFVISILSAFVISVLKYLSLSNWLILPIQLLLWLLIIWGLCELIKTEEYKEVKLILMSSLHNIHSRIKSDK